MRPNVLLTLFVLSVAGGLAVRAAGQGPEFLPAQQVGTVQYSALNEASGIAASRVNPDVLWAHNDSGDTARVFAMNLQGTHLGIYTLAGATATDWEDMAVGPGPGAGQSYLYLGDIGDNSAVRPNIRVYRMPEPVISLRGEPLSVSLSGYSTITLQYPDGPRDAETLMVDPLTADLYIVSKRQTPSRLYRAPYPQSTSGINVMEYRGQLPWGWATGGDISPSGGEILVRGGSNVSLWRRPADTTVWAAFTQPAYTVPLATEPQGEAICFQSLGHGYFTLSEGSHQPLYYYQRVPAAGDLECDGDVDGDDFAILAECLAGPDGEPAPECEEADLTNDGDADLADFAVFQRGFTGA